MQFFLVHLSLAMEYSNFLDPKILLGDNNRVKKNTEKYLNIFQDYPYIFNLGHGVLPEIKPETIEYIIQLVRNKK